MQPNIRKTYFMQSSIIELKAEVLNGIELRYSSKL